MNLKTLNKVLDQAIVDPLTNFVDVEISNPDLPRPEIIRNPKQNLIQKKKYFNIAYGDIKDGKELALKAAPHIRITAIKIFKLNT